MGSIRSLDDRAVVLQSPPLQGRTGAKRSNAKSAPTTGKHPSLESPGCIELLTEQYRQHPSWSYQLHADNLAVLVEQQPQAGPMPSYASLSALHEEPRACSSVLAVGRFTVPALRPPSIAIEAREVRSYESEYVNGLWHLDFHHGSLRVLLDRGRWVYPMLLGHPR